MQEEGKRDFVYSIGKSLAILGVFLLFVLRDFYSHKALEIFRKLPSSHGQWRGASSSHIPSWTNLNVQDRLGYTFLSYAVERANLSSLRALLLRGADPNIRDIFGQTPLHLAAMYGELSSIRILRDFGANLNLKDHAAKTPIFYATERGAQECVKVLVQMGAELFLEDDYGRTLLDRAVARNYRNIVLYLLGRMNAQGFREEKEIVSYLDYWQKKYAPLFRLKTTFSEGLLYYFCASFGVLFFLSQEEESQNSYFPFLQEQPQKNPTAIFHWLSYE